MSSNKKVNKVLLDTCFLIELSDKTKEKHQNAKDYFDYFNEHDIPYFLSPIVVSEYWQNDLIEDFPTENFRYLSFNYPEGHKAAEINRILKKIKESNNGNPNSIKKDYIKDDIKIIAHLLVTNDIDCFITKDSTCINDYINPIKEKVPELAKKIIIDINEPITSNFVPQSKIAFPEDSK